MEPTSIEGLDLATATEQDVFDFVVFTLIRQGQQASNEDGTCLYRAPEGRKCAVGQLIPHECYDSLLESRSCDVVIDSVPPLRAWAGRAADDAAGSRHEFLRRLQRRHDCPEDYVGEGVYEGWLSAFRRAAREFARLYGLDDSMTRFRETVAA